MDIESIYNFIAATSMLKLLTACVAVVSILLTVFGSVIQNFRYARDIEKTKTDIKNLETTEKDALISYKDFVLGKVQHASKMQELMMVNARPRADLLFRIGVILLVLSLACPVIATWLYWRVDPISDGDIAKITLLKQSMGELPKDFNLSISRDWHLLAGGITFGFLCLAAAKGILTQQANEMKTYFALGQKVRYFERLHNVAELLLWEDAESPESKKAVIILVTEKLLNDTPVAREPDEESKGKGEESAVAKLIAEALKAAQGGKVHAG